MKSNLKQFLILPLIAIICLPGCSKYGEKVKHGHIEVFYLDGISKEQAQQTADVFYMIDSVNNNISSKKSMQLCVEKDSFCFRMVVDEKRLASVPDDAFSALGNILSDSVFNGKPVNVDLTDNHFKTIRTVHYQKIDFDVLPADSAQ